MSSRRRGRVRSRLRPCRRCEAPVATVKPRSRRLLASWSRNSTTIMPKTTPTKAARMQRSPICRRILGFCGAARAPARPPAGRRQLVKAEAMERGAAAFPAPDRGNLRRDPRQARRVPRPGVRRGAQDAGRHREGQKGWRRLRQGAQAGQRCARCCRRRAQGQAGGLERLRHRVRDRVDQGCDQRIQGRDQSMAASPSRSNIRTRAASSGRPIG